MRETAGQVQAVTLFAWPLYGGSPGTSAPVTARQLHELEAIVNRARVLGFISVTDARLEREILKDARRRMRENPGDQMVALCAEAPYDLKTPKDVSREERRGRKRRRRAQKLARRRNRR